MRNHFVQSFLYANRHYILAKKKKIIIFEIDSILRFASILLPEKLRISFQSYKLFFYRDLAIHNTYSMNSMMGLLHMLCVVYRTHIGTIC